MLKNLSETIDKNRTFIKRLFLSDASIFCFFQPVEYSGGNYNTLIILKNTETLAHEELGGRTNSLRFIHLKFKRSIQEKLDFDFTYLEYGKLLDEVIEGFFSNAQYGQDIHSKKSEQEIISLILKKHPTYFNINNSIYSFEDEKLAAKFDLSTFDNENYYKVYTKKTFVDSIKFNWDIYRWKTLYKYGLIIKYKEFLQKCSDFDSNHYLKYVLSNPAYNDFRQKNIAFYERIAPRDYASRKIVDGNILKLTSDSDSVDQFWSEIFDYFYDGKKLLIANFDDMALGENPSYGRESSTALNEKLYLPPEFIMDKSFILTNELIEISRTNQGAEPFTIKPPILIKKTRRY